MWEIFVNKLRLHTKKQSFSLERPIAGKNWNISDSYINLALLLSQKKYAEENENYKEQNKALVENTIDWHDLHVNQAEKVYESKQALNYKDLFKPMTGDKDQISPSKVWLVGAAGSGKTTLSQCIANDWSGQHNVQVEETKNEGNTKQRFLGNISAQIDLVIWIKLRELAADLEIYADADKDNSDIKSKATKATLADKHFCLSFLRILQKQGVDIEELDLSVEEINQILKDNSTNTLFLLDGYDEIASFSSAHAVHSIFHFLLRQPNVLVTSRPYYDIPAVAGVNREAFRRVELLGFSLADMKQYISKHFEDSIKSSSYNSLKQLIEENLTVRGIGHIPVNLEILCTALGAGTIKADELVDVNITNLYSRMVSYLIRRALHSDKVQQLSTYGYQIFDGRELSSNKTIFGTAAELGWFWGLGNLALQGLIQKQVSFPSETVSQQLCIYRTEHQTETVFLNDVIALGFIRGLIRSQDNKCYEGQGEFLHLTLQEYFAAWFIAENWKRSPDGKLFKSAIPETTARQLLQTYKYNPRFTLVWPFVVGLLGQSNVYHVENFAAEFERLPLDLLSSRHYSSVLRCLEELPNVKQTPQHWQALVGNLQEIIQQWEPNNYFQQTSPQNLVVIALRNSPRWSWYYVVTPLINNSLFASELVEEKQQELIRTRILAIFQQINFVKPTPEFLSKIVTCLQDDRVSIRQNAIQVVYKLGHAVTTPEILSILTACEQDKDDSIRQYATKALKKLVPPVINFVPLSSSSLCSRDSKKTILPSPKEAGNTLNPVLPISERLSILATRLRDKNVEIRRSVIVDVEKLGAAAATTEILSALATCLRDDDQEVHLGAAELVCKLYSTATSELFSALIACLRKDNLSIRQSAVSVIGRLGSVVMTPRMVLVLTTYLQEKNVGISLNIAEVVGRLGPIAATPAFLSWLAMDLGSDNPDIRWCAAYAVGRFGSVAATPAMLSALTTYLRGENTDIRWNVMYAVGRLGSAAATPEILSALIECLRDSNPDIRWSVVYVVGRLGSAVLTAEFLSSLVACLEERIAPVSCSAAYVVDRLGLVAATPEILSALAACLRESDLNIRLSAIKTLSRLGSAVATPEIYLALATCLQDDNETIYLNTVNILGNWGPTAIRSEILLALAVCLRKNNRNICVDAANVVSRLGSVAATTEILSALSGCLQHDDVNIRWNAMYAVDRLGSAAATPEILLALSTNLRDKNASIRRIAMAVVDGFGSAAATPEILSALLVCFQDDVEDIHRKAVNLLFSLDSTVTPDIILALGACLQKNNADIRQNVANVVCRLGVAAVTTEFLSVLDSCLRNGNSDIRSSVVEVVSKLGTIIAVPEMLSMLVACLQDCNLDIRLSALEVTSKLGSAAATPEMLLILSVCLRDDDKRFRRRVVEIVNSLDFSVATSEMLSALVTCLQDDDENIHKEAANIIYKLGPAAVTPEMLSTLAKCLQDTNATIRRRAVDMIAKLGVDAATPEMLSVLVTCLRVNDENIRLNAVNVVNKLGSVVATPMFLLGLVTCLQDGNANIRRSATSVVSKLDFAAATPEFLTILFEAFDKCLDETIREDISNAFRFFTLVSYPTIYCALLQSANYLERFFNKAETVVLCPLKQEGMLNYRLISLDNRGETLPQAELVLAESVIKNILNAMNQFRRKHGINEISEEKTSQQSTVSVDKVTTQNRSIATVYEMQNLLENDRWLSRIFKDTLNNVKEEAKKQNWSYPNGVFISYAWPDPQLLEEQDLHCCIQPFLTNLRQHLQLAGINKVLLDIKDCEHGESIYKFMTDNVTKSEFILLIGTESLLKKHTTGVYLIQTELAEIEKKRRKDSEQGKYNVLPILLSGDFHTSFPSQYIGYTNISDWRGVQEHYVTCLQRLLERLYQQPSDALSRFFCPLSAQFSTRTPTIEPASSEELFMSTRSLSSSSMQSIAQSSDMFFSQPAVCSMRCLNATKPLPLLEFTAPM